MLIVQALGAAAPLCPPRGYRSSRNTTSTGTAACTINREGRILRK